jgi:hypothetical protein
MITRSDNTTTDMMFRSRAPTACAASSHRQGSRPRWFRTARAFTGYLSAHRITRTSPGQLQEAVRPGSESVLNTVQTLASSAEDLVSYYSRVAGRVSTLKR